MMLEVLLEVNPQAAADHREVEAAAIIGVDRGDAFERAVDIDIRHPGSDKLDRAEIRAEDADHRDRAVEGRLDVEVGAHQGIPVIGGPEPDFGRAYYAAAPLARHARRSSGRS